MIVISCVHLSKAGSVDDPGSQAVETARHGGL